MIMNTFSSFDISADTATKLNLIEKTLASVAVRPHAEALSAGARCASGPNVGCGGGSQGCWHYPAPHMSGTSPLIAAL